ncbi:NERD domain-containing protein [Macrococcus animalis]|uniref:NERD domain-containing protein n=1 Tax=Macrococcus animalis TaxID=3395467 RepID=UPI0039BDE32E
MQNIILEILNSRDAYFNQIKKLEKLRLGALGEKMVREVIEGFDCIDAIHDILFEVDGSYFQIDHLIITGNHLIVLDAKFYSSDVFIKDGDWYCDDLQIRDPLKSLNTTVTQHMKKMLYQNGINLKITGYMVWCNENTYIYGLDKSLPIIQYNRLDLFLRNLLRHRISMHSTAELYELRSKYNPFLKHYPEKIDEMLTGLNCPNCFSLLGERTKKKYHCRSCGESHYLEEVVFKNLQFYCLVKEENNVDIYDFHRFINMSISVRTLNDYLKKWIYSSTIKYIKKRHYFLIDSLFFEK